MDDRNKKDWMKKTPLANDPNPSCNDTGYVHWLHTLKELNEEQRSFISSCLLFGEKLLKLAGSEVNIHNYTPKHLDQLLTWWHEGDLSDSGIDKQRFIEVTGALFGHFLNRQYNSHWTCYEENDYKEYACFTNQEKGSSQFYPFSIIQHIIENKHEKLTNIIELIK